jgi:hypothetical protein
MSSLSISTIPVLRIRSSTRLASSTGRSRQRISHGEKLFAASGASPTIRAVWELAEAVPDRVRAFWARVEALYTADQYGPAFEEAFRVLDLAAVQRAQEGGAAGIRHFHNAVEWLRAKSVIKARSHPTLPGDLWTVAVRARNRLTHHENAQFPMVLNRASCDWTFPAFVAMLNELWEPTPTDA